MNKILFGILVIVLFFIVGIGIIDTKSLPVKYGKDVYIGNYAYLVGSIFILFCIWVLYNLITSDSKESEEEKQNNE